MDQFGELITCPIQEGDGAVLCDEEATVLEFYGLYWVLEVGEARTGFFNTEDDAVRYLQDQMSVAEEGGKGDE